MVRSHVDVGPGNEDCDDAAISAIIEAAVYKRAGMTTQCQPHITLHMRTLFLVMMAFRSTITFHLNAILGKGEQSALSMSRNRKTNIQVFILYLTSIKLHNFAINQ